MGVYDCSGEYGVISKWRPKESPLGLILNKQTHGEIRASVFHENTFEVHNKLGNLNDPLMVFVLPPDIHGQAGDLAKVTLYIVLSKKVPTDAQIDWSLIKGMGKLKAFRIAFYWTRINKPALGGTSTEWNRAPLLLGIVLDVVRHIPKPVALQWGPVSEVLEAAQPLPRSSNDDPKLEFIDRALLEGIAPRFAALRGENAPGSSVTLSVI